MAEWVSEWVDICRAGTWIAKDGRRVTFTAGDLDRIASAYDPKEREAPLVLGHPKDDAPAYGWVHSMRRAGQILQARFKEVASEVKELVSKGRYKKISIALFPDGKTLRHVGLLGAAQPAVSGLRSVRFEEGSEGVVIEFSAKEETMEKEELQRQLDEERKKREAAEGELSREKERAKKSETELSAYQAKQRERELDGKLNDLVAQDRIDGGERTMLREVALVLAESGKEIELTAGAGKKPVLGLLFDFLGKLPAKKLLTEFSAPEAKDDSGKPVDLTRCV